MGMAMTKRLQVVAEVERIKRERQLSQQQLADAIGVSQPTVSAWLSRSDLPSSDSLRKIGKAYTELIGLIAEAALEAVLAEADNPARQEADDAAA